MVEGPGCKQNGERLRSKVLGQKVKSVCGSVTNGTCFTSIIGLEIIDTKTLGKELFIYFDKDLCLKIHFMFNGCFRFGSENRCDLKNEEPLIMISLTRENFSFYYGKVNLASVTECEQKYKEFIDSDICSPTFNAEKVQKAIMKQTNRLICDVLLDQRVLPGVGNVIKNEALFMANINPNTLVKELSCEVIAHCVLKTREFTMYFSKLRQKGSWKKETKALVHGQTKCKNCSNRITVCKLGENRRLTYFCSHCQNNSPVTQNVTIAEEVKSSSHTIKSNKLTGKQDQSISKWFKPSTNCMPWSCTHCTLINKFANDKCNACFQPKEFTEEKTVSSIIGRGAKENFENVMLWTCKHCTLVNKLANDRCNACYQPKEFPEERSVGLTDENILATKETSNQNVLLESEKSSNQNVITLKKKTYQDLISKKREPEEAGDTSTKFKFRKLDHTHDLGKLPDKKNVQGNDFKVDTESNNLTPVTNIVVCSGHKKTAKKSSVSKNNENKGRPFLSCGQPQKCNFFKWADDHHPKCTCGRITVQRQCYKNNSNNGRHFFCCPNQKQMQCNFFKWIE